MIRHFFILATGFLLSPIPIMPSQFALADEISEQEKVVEKPTFDDKGQIVNPENEMGQKETDTAKASPTPRPDPSPKMPPENQIPNALAGMGMGQYFSEYAFFLDKSLRTLSIWKNTANGPLLVEAHAVDMGRVDGDKLVLGDKKTPEGIYFFQTTYAQNQLDFNEYGDQAYTMDYPNLFDRRENKTGSGIWLHAIPNTKTLFRGSRGCIVVRNKVIKSLAKYIDYKKTPIIVQKNGQYIPLAQWKSKRSQLVDWLDNWRESWEAMEIQLYMKFYSNEFYSARMNKERWRDFKTELNKKYEFIRVQVAKPTFYFHEDEAVIRFLQHYKSNIKGDFGEKTLHLKKSAAGNWEIIAENWKPVSRRLMALLTETSKP